MFTIRRKINQKKPVDDNATTQDVATVKLALIQALELGKSEPFSLSTKNFVFIVVFLVVGTLAAVTRK